MEMALMFLPETYQTVRARLNGLMLQMNIVGLLINRFTDNHLPKGKVDNHV